MRVVCDRVGGHGSRPRDHVIRTAGRASRGASRVSDDRSMTRECDGLLLDVGVVLLKSVWEVADEFEQAEGLPPRTFPGRGPFDDLGSEFVDEKWEAYRRGEITEREYWLGSSEAAVANGAPLNGHPHLMRAIFQREGVHTSRPEGVALLRAAKAAGLRTGILSNELMDFQGREWVEAQEWFPLFDVIVDATEIGVRKPDPRPYEVAISAMELPADRLVFVDDSPAYVAGGERAGIRSILLDVLEPWRAFDEAARLLGLEPIGKLAT